MLYEQLDESSTHSTWKSASGGPSFASGTVESTTQEVVRLDEKSRAVEEELDYRKLIGSLDVQRGIVEVPCDALGLVRRFRRATGD